MKSLIAIILGGLILSFSAMGQEGAPERDNAIEDEESVPLTEDGQLDLAAMLAAQRADPNFVSREDVARSRAETAAATARLEQERTETEQERAETAATKRVVDLLSLPADIEPRADVAKSLEAVPEARTLEYIDEEQNFSISACMADGVPPADCGRLSTHYKKILIAESQARQVESQARQAELQAQQNASGDRIGEEARKLLEALED